MRFSKRVEKLLGDAGWFEGRRIDTSRFEAFLAKQGFPVHECVRSFLVEFGDLVLNCAASPHLGKKSTMHFKIKMAARHRYFCGTVDGIPVDRQLCVIGGCWGTTGRLNMDEFGVVYASNMDGLFLAGSSGDEAIEKMCIGSRLPPSNIRW